MKKLFLSTLLLCLAASPQARSHLDTSREANLTIGGAYHNWIMGEPSRPPVLCLYGQRTGALSASLTAAQIFNGRCPKQIGDNPLFGIAYFVPPSHDSELARDYFENAACGQAEKLGRTLGVAPTLVMLVYAADVTGRALYVYCITVPDEGYPESDWY